MELIGKPSLLSYISTYKYFDKVIIIVFRARKFKSRYKNQGCGQVILI